MLSRPQDYPRLRKYDRCPLCSGEKSSGPLCCWPCYNKHAVDGSAYTNPNPWAEARFRRAEANLHSVENFDATFGQFEIIAQREDARR